MGSTRIRASLAACVLGALVCSTESARAESSPRKPVVVSGSASNVGGVLTTADSGAVIELPSRARLRVGPNSSLRVFPLPQLLALQPGARTWTWSFALQSGRVDVDMPKAGRNAVLASMGKLSAIVTGGHAAFRVDGNEATTANIEGEVRSLVNEHWQTIPLGWTATLNKEDPNALAKPGLPGPTLASSQRMWFAPNETVAMHGFHWSRVPGASAYELRVRRLADGKVIDQRVSKTPEMDTPLTPVEAGKYSVAVRSIDARGMEGGWSAESELRVIGVVLPPGAYSTEQAIFLSVGQQVQFTNTAGLEMTYLGAGRYFPAAQGAGLYRGQKTVIGFRMPGVLDTAIARLEPRGIYADVQIGPRSALWPRDPITIDIQLKSQNGSEVPAFLQAVPTVTVGLDPVEVNFEQDGNTLHAVVPPSTKPGPWIVRVDVADQYGGALGHDFLEIAAQPRKQGPAVQIVTPEKPAAPPPRQLPKRDPAAEPPVASRN
ncbi:MAG TPA: hypothetical protein VER96_25400 [Polyangiaceae bacterium]|nr:hypothetical protein [Polyangiaceae bacterium]